MHPSPPIPRFDAPVRPGDARAVRRRYRRGETLLHAGDVGDVLKIEQGLVELVVPAFDGRDRILAVLGSGDLLGVEAALGHEALVADAVALGAVTVVACDRAAFLTDLRSDPVRAFAVAQSVVRRLRAAWDDQACAYRPVQERLAAAMVDLAQRFGEPGHDGRRVLTCGLNHQAFASLIGAQRASVSVAMAEFRRAHAAAGARGTYTIDVVRLRELAGAALPAVVADGTAPAWLRTPPDHTVSASHTTTSTPWA
jgi:CRP-like cAMP-binding protein